ncbi:MAG: hypothetical protein ABIS50_25565 [Luteolibacter sp.]|uniref:hypothetical protein n=1 Tax=Luteolibacter sp. TaxID=1962973 RepID=UPI003264B902
MLPRLTWAMRFLAFIFLVPLATMAERINHEGRILGDLPVITTPLLFNTPEADAVVSALQMMPRDNAWNEDVSQRPALTGSDAMIARVKSDLAVNAGRQNLRLFSEMNYVLVPDSQPAIPVNYFVYPADSDLDGGTSPIGLCPIPENMPIEGWPVETDNLTNDQWQQATTNDDRHAIVVKPGTGAFWEMWLAKRNGAAWEAANGAKWNLGSNALREAGLTSADAASLQMFPAIVRYDECQRGMVEHALRLIVKNTRLGPIYPATHQASVPPTSDPNVPAMGQRFRLKSSFAIPSNWTIQEKAVLLALKKYGAIVADNGGFFSVSVAPDNRFPADCFDHIRNSIDVNNFEVIQTTGATEGPRSPGSPTADAGADQWIAAGTTGPSVNLVGAVSAPGAVSIQWKLYSGPAPVVFGNATNAITSATFGIPGKYTLMLSAADNIHAVAYDAVVITVTLNPAVTTTGNDVQLSFPTTTGHHYLVQKSADLVTWQTLVANLNGTGVTLTVTDAGALNHPDKHRFYRITVVD